jgi:hypothetical protein
MGRSQDDRVEIGLAGEQRVEAGIGAGARVTYGGARRSFVEIGDRD